MTDLTTCSYFPLMYFDARHENAIIAMRGPCPTSMRSFASRNFQKAPSLASHRLTLQPPSSFSSTSTSSTATSSGSARNAGSAAQQQRRVADLLALLQETGEIAVATGPRGISRALQGATALANLAQSYLRDGTNPLDAPQVLLRKLFESLGSTYIKVSFQEGEEHMMNFYEGGQQEGRVLAWYSNESSAFLTHSAFPSLSWGSSSPPPHHFSLMSKLTKLLWLEPWNYEVMEELLYIGQTTAWPGVRRNDKEANNDVFFSVAGTSSNSKSA